MERKIHFRQNWLIILEIWGEADSILRIWGAKEKYFQGAEEFDFRNLGRSKYYFQGSREHRPLWGPQYAEIFGTFQSPLLTFPFTTGFPFL